MTDKEFFKRIANGKGDFLGEFLKILEKNKISYCVIGGLAVNAYAEPVVSLDLDVVLVTDKIKKIEALLKKRCKVEHFPNSINISSKSSDLRIQIQTDERYQLFIKKAKVKEVLGYKLSVATIEDVFQGKIWAASDKERRPSKRQKDLADIMRLIEVKSELKDHLPENLKKQLYPNA